MNSKAKEPQTEDRESAKAQECECSAPSQVQDAPGPLFPFPKGMKIELHL